MSSKMQAPHEIPATYAELASQWIPRPLRDEADYENALAILDTMAGFDMNADQADYFDAVSTFVERYEGEHHAIDSQNLSPVELLRALMQEHGMSESDLGRLLGNRSLGHRILTGERGLSKNHIRILANHFALNPAAFL